MSQDITVGQILYREVAHRNQPAEIKEYTVSKIGRQYFYLQGWEKEYPIQKETLMHINTQYSQSSFQLYRDKQEILDKNEMMNLTHSLRKHFDWMNREANNTLEELRKAAEILRIKKQD